MTYRLYILATLSVSFVDSLLEAKYFMKETGNEC